MLVSLDNVAQRYGVLPSVALATGDTLDLMVLQTATRFSEYQNSDEYKNNHGKTTKELQRMLEGVKHGNNKEGHNNT
tara:strand:+ start:668 stop:898 length:231 start_codon:yes stop_codon:yes gene_type:complete